MRSSIFRCITSLLSILLLSILLVACGDSATTSTVTTPASTPVASTPTQPADAAATPTTATTPTAATAPTTAAAAATRPAAAAPATTNANAPLQQFTGTGFTISYPGSWKASQNKTTTGKTFYSFLYADQITGFHVELHSQYFDVDSPVLDLTGKQTNCNPGNTALPQTKTLNGITWDQGDMLCPLAGTNYEVRLLSHTDSKTNDTTTIVYGAYQQQTATSPAFVQVDKAYFEPMLESFRFTA